MEDVGNHVDIIRPYRQEEDQNSHLSRDSSETSGIGSTLVDSISIMEDDRVEKDNNKRDQECQVQIFKAPDGGCWVM